MATIGANIYCCCCCCSCSARELSRANTGRDWMTMLGEDCSGGRASAGLTVTATLSSLRASPLYTPREGWDVRIVATNRYPNVPSSFPYTREWDPLLQKREVRRLLALAHFLGWQLQKRLEKCLIVRPRETRGLKHLIVGCIELVISEWRTEQCAGRFWHGDVPYDPSGSSTAMWHPRGTLAGDWALVQSKLSIAPIQFSVTEPNSNDWRRPYAAATNVKHGASHPSRFSPRSERVRGPDNLAVRSWTR